jgi:DNA-binding SARP family transcriptional activator
VDYRLLGPVEIVADGKTLPLGRRQERLLLALLVLSANQLVPAERLISLLWQEKVPDTPSRTLQVYVSRLRKALPAGQTLEARDQGYQLTVDPSTIDVHRFRAAVRQAENTGDPGRRAELLRDALALWRGPALVDVASEELRWRLCADLEEGRLQALESRIEAELESGLDHQLVAELAALVVDHPTRQRLVAAQAIALYRAGRAPDALDVLRDAKRSLADELGLDPGPRLQEIETAILQNNAELLSPRQPGNDVPRQLPSSVSGFVGRVDAAQALTRLLTERADGAGGAGGPVVVVSAIAGMGGVGKTALAVEVANRVAPEFPDGQLFLNLRGYGAEEPMPAQEALGILLRSLGVPDGDVPTNAGEAASKYRTVLAGRRVLVVLDNAAQAAVIEQLLPGAGDSAVIVTSRTQLPQLNTSRTLQLDALDHDEARLLLEQLVGADRVRAEPDAAEAILAACGNLPLAIRVVGARLAARPRWPISHLADRIADQRQRLDHLDPEGKGLRAVLASSLEQLRKSADAKDRDAARAFVSLGIPDTPQLRLVEAARILGSPEETAEDLLEHLVDAQLLDTPQPGTYRLHDLLWSYAREQAEALLELPDREAAVQRLLDLYCVVAWRSLAIRTPTATRLEWAVGRHTDDAELKAPTGEACFDWLDDATVESAAVQGVRMSAETRRLVLVLALGLGSYHRSRLSWFDAIQVGVPAVQIARDEGDQVAEGLILGDLGVAWAELGDFDAAIGVFRQSIDLLWSNGETRPALATSANFTYVLYEAKRYDEGIEVGQSTLRLAIEAGDVPLTGSAHLGLGTLYRAVGDNAAERRHLQGALDAAVVAPNDWRKAYILSKLGTLDHRTGRLAAAIQNLRASIAIYESLSQDSDKADTAGELGEALLAVGEAAEAVGWLRTGLAEARRTADRDRESVLLRRLGEAQAALEAKA